MPGQRGRATAATPADTVCVAGFLRSVWIVAGAVVRIVRVQSAAVYSLRGGWPLVLTGNDSQILWVFPTMTWVGAVALGGY